MTQKLSDAQIGARRDAVVAAATAIFLRYGYVRTTMADLAGAARVSRPALYLLFADKDEIFAAVIRRLNGQMLDELRAALTKLRTLDSKLHRCCGDWGAHGFELMERHPDAKDLFDLALPVVREMYELFVDFIAALLVAPIAASRSKASAQEVARNLVYSFRGLKEAAKDSAHLRRLIHLQVELLIAALEA